MNVLGAIFQRSSGYNVAAMISETAFHDSMRVIRGQTEPNKLEKSPNALKFSTFIDDLLRLYLASILVSPIEHQVDVETKSQTCVA